jgi:hypothetical protein
MLGVMAFQACSSLESICIPSSVETISTSCFIHCFNRCTITFERRTRLDCPSCP